jgi:predicted alpha/beta hydrolase
MPYVDPATGYDVWMGNTRGNTYSRRTLNGLYPYQAEFWYFSLDELALVDVPTMIDYALEKTGASKLAFVGHSQVRGLLCVYKAADNWLRNGVCTSCLHA